MSKTRNCPNCGAVIDVERTKCAYCGTSYYDLSSMSLNEPFYLQLNIGTPEHPNIILQMVYISNASISHQVNPVTVAYGNGYTQFYDSPEVKYTMEFIGIGDCKKIKGEYTND